MANYAATVNSPETVKLWSRKLTIEALKETWYEMLHSDSSDGVIYVKDELNKSEGDRVRCILRMQMSQAGIAGDNTGEGNEEAIQTFTMDLFINQLRFLARTSGRMTQQRVPFSVREQMMQGLADLWRERMDTWVMNCLASNTAQTDTRYTGHNSVTTADSSHQIYAGVATDESNLSADTSQIFSLAIIDRAKLRAMTVTPVIRPAKVGGKTRYIMFISPEQHFDLRRNTSTNEYIDIAKSVDSGWGRGENPLFAGGTYIGQYNGVGLYESFRLPRITTGGGANQGGRAVLCGAQALVASFGRGNSPEKFTWVEEDFDYENQLGIAAGSISGMTKARYNSRDFATVIASTQHSADARTASGR
jgi:N4-gp56 family major capsid protein